NPWFSIFSTTCEMLDTSDPDNKIFRFRDDCKWGHNAYGKPAAAREVRGLSTWTHWSEFDVGTKEAEYRVIAVLEPPPGYRVALEGTTKPKVIEPLPPDISDEESRCEQAIMAALESEPRVSQRELRRKTSS